MTARRSGSTKNRSEDGSVEVPGLTRSATRARAGPSNNKHGALYLLLECSHRLWPHSESTRPSTFITFIITPGKSLLVTSKSSLTSDTKMLDLLGGATSRRRGRAAGHHIGTYRVGKCERSKKSLSVLRPARGCVRCVVSRLLAEVVVMSAAQGRGAHQLMRGAAPEEKWTPHRIFLGTHFSIRAGPARSLIMDQWITFFTISNCCNQPISNQLG